jgi:hypothetical protein
MPSMMTKMMKIQPLKRCPMYVAVGSGSDAGLCAWQSSWRRLQMVV